jgi:hypothetical protein
MIIVDRPYKDHRQGGAIRRLLHGKGIDVAIHQRSEVKRMLLTPSRIGTTVRKSEGDMINIAPPMAPPATLSTINLVKALRSIEARSLRAAATDDA